MLDIPIIAWLLTLSGIILASASGVALSSRIPWGAVAVQGRVPTAAGLVFGPLLAGMATVVALLLLPGQSHTVHIVAVAVMLLAACGFYRPSPAPRDTVRLLRISSIQQISFLDVVLFLWIIVLVVLPSLLPLTQNDALEYATVARVLYEARDLQVYPAIHPETTASGFFGPWTHPPLFVALLYLGYSLQGTELAPGLSRLITPWFTIACVWLVYRMAGTISKTTGLFAALIFISSPLFFLGADSSLIDSLPIAGLLLSFSILIFAPQERYLSAGAFAGLALGLALWTHSQAILFIPILGCLVYARQGLKGLKTATLQNAAMFCIALCLCAYPYLRNYQIFGALVSDMPAVFALPSLRWEDYFTIGRGIGHWPAKIQYGLLKGWFAPESYSGSFWLASLGFGVFLWRYGRMTATLVVRGVDLSNKDLNLLYSALLVICAYLCAVALSVMMGIELAIRNERYWLILLPFIAIFGGWALNAMLSRLERARTRIWALGLVCTVGFVFLAQLAVLTLYRAGPYLSTGSQPSLAASQWSAACEASLQEQPGEEFCPAHSISAENWQRATPSLMAMRYLEALTPQDSVTFTMFPAMMYYSQRKMLSYLDPRMIPFYAADTAEEGVHLLRNLGVAYIHATNYYLPPVYHSVLQEILFRQDLSTLVFSAEGEQIYRLAPEKPLRPSQIRNITPGPITWTREQTWALGGRKSFGRSALIGAGGDAMVGQTSSLVLPYGLFQRNRTVVLTSGSPQPAQPEDALFRVQPRIPMGLRIKFAGQGYIQFRIEQYDASYAYLGSIPLGDMSITNTSADWLFERRFIPSRNASFIRVSVEHAGESTISLNDVSLVTYAPAEVAP